MGWYDHYEEALLALKKVEDHADSDPLTALRYLAKTSSRFGDIAMPLAQQALDAGATKKAIATALDIPPSYLRGLEKTRTR